MSIRRPSSHARAVTLSAMLGALLAGCAATPPVAGSTAGSAGTAAREIQILALNDFHGNLVAPDAKTSWHDGTAMQEGRLGGAAQMGAALAQLRQGIPHTITVAAGDLIGASPLESAYFLDEPSIMALGAIGLDIAAVGNHEFDRGTAELRRMQDGGCAKNTLRTPCALDQFAGARFDYLAANVLDDRGETLFPGTVMRDFGGVKLGFIGMTLKGTDTLVAPSATAGYRFADEAETANRLAQELKAQGADAVILLIHEGGRVDPFLNVTGCPSLSGSIVPILDNLDPAIGLVVSGHTHAAYVCDRPARDGSPRLLTSAGRYGNFVTDIRLSIGGAGQAPRFVARNYPVHADGAEQADVASLVRRYVDAAAPISAQVAGRIHGPLEPRKGDTDYALANLVADAHLAYTADPAKGGAQFAFINSGGLRGQLVPAADGTLTYGQIFAFQPFGNVLTVLELTGDQLRRVLEQQFTADSPAIFRQSMLIPSHTLNYRYDRKAPVGSRVTAITLQGVLIDPAARYRVTVNNFLASGGDGFSVLAEGRVITDGALDLDALQAFIAQGATVAELGRVVDGTSTD
ncbi:bifunctional metallophosphatase/5'-nucleotidase [Croceibacterium xixiisoli]|nr:bifunctional metallophosphatase/5'-nucleotidase [Croceibacterium xixiisoli]